MAEASPITVLWDESVDGDLWGGGQDLAPFEVGLNSILGSTTLTRENGNAARLDGDSAFIDLLAGRRIVSIEAAVLSMSEFGGKILSPTIGLNLSGPDTTGIYRIDLSSSSIITDTLPAIEPSNYWMYVGFGASLEDNAELTLNWRIDFDVAEAPLPGTLSLLGVGIAAIGFQRRKRAA